MKEATGDLLVFMGADGADDPRYLPQMISPIEEGRADLVLGSWLNGRVKQGAMPWHQYAGNWLSSMLIRKFYRINITDLSPFRAVTRIKLLPLQMEEMTYGWPTEMIVKAALSDWQIQGLPVIYHPRQGGKSKISGTLRGTILATYFILRAILKYYRWRKA